MPARTKKEMRLILRFFEVSSCGLHVYRQAGVRPLHPQKHGKRHGDEIILILPQNAANSFHHSDDQEFIVGHANGLADGVRGQKQLLHQRVSDQTEICAVIRFRGGEKSAQRDHARVNIRHRRRLTVKAHVLNLFVPSTRANRGAGGRSNFAAIRAAFGDRAYIVDIDFLVFQGLDDDVKVRHREGRARDLKHIRAQISDFMLHVTVRALDDGHHRNQRGDSHGQPQHGQRRAHLVGAQRAETLGQIIANSQHGLGSLQVTLTYPGTRIFVPGLESRP